MLDTGILTNILDTFIKVFSLGLTNLFPDTQHLLGIVAALEVCFAGLLWALDGGQKLEVEFLKKVLLIGFFIWVVSEYRWLVETVLNGFVYVGETASGREASYLTNPSLIVDEGFRVTGPIYQKIYDYRAYEFWKVLDIFYIRIICLLIILSYFAIAITVLITYIEFYLVAVLGLILIPFGIFKHTSFLTEKVFGAIIAFGIKLMVLAFILGVIEPVLAPFSLPPDPSHKQVCTLLLAVFAVAVLSWHAPAVASGLMAGAPSLGVGAVAGTGLAIGAGVALAGGAAIGAARTIARAGYDATKAAAGAISHHGGHGKGGSAAGGGKALLPSPPSTAGRSGTSSAAGAGSASKKDGKSSAPSSGRPAWAQNFLIAHNAIPHDSSPGPGMSVPVRHD